MPSSTRKSSAVVHPLFSAIKQIKSALASTEMIEFSTDFIFTGKLVIAGAYGIYASVPLSMPTRKPIAVDGKALLRLMKSLSDEITSIKFVKGDLIIHAGNQKARLYGRHADTMRPSPAVAVGAKGWRDLHPDFWKAVARVQPLASRDHSEFKYMHIHLYPDFVEATDNFQIGRYWMRTGLTEISSVVATQIKPFIKSGLSQVAETEGWLHLRNSVSGLSVSFQQWHDLKYPDLTRHFDIEGDRLCLPDEIVASIAKAADLARFCMVAGFDFDHVQLTVTPSHVTVSSGAPEVGQYRASHAAYYEGQPRIIRVCPKVLTGIVKQFRELQVTRDRLKGEDGDYVYVAAVRTAKVKRTSNHAG